MPTYYTDIAVDEDGFGPTVVRFVVSDTYAGLTAAGTEVSVIKVTRVAKDLDVDTGVYAVDEADLELRTWMAETADDSDCVAFMLDAQDLGLPRYLGVLHDPSPTPQPDEFNFRGVIQPEMQWTDDAAEFEEWTPAENLDRTWRVTAGSYDVTAILDQELWSDESAGTTGLVDQLDTEALGVADKLGYFFSSGTDGHGHREVRFADMVNWQAVIQGLIDLASPPGITMTYEPQPTGFQMSVCEFFPVPYDGRTMRWCLQYNLNSDGSEGGLRTVYRVPGLSAPFDVWAGDGPDNKLEIDWKLLKGHTSQESALSWRRYKTLAELLYAQAAGLNMYVQFDYLSAVDIRIRFVSRTDILGDTVLLRTLAEGSGDIAPAGGDQQRSRGFTAAASQYSRDGYTPYFYDRGFLQVIEANRPKLEGDVLPLTIGPTWCNYSADPGLSKVKDAGVRPQWQFVLLPHNCIWYDSSSAPKNEADPEETFPPEPRYNTVGLHTGIYLHITATADHKGHGISGKEVVLPVRMFWAPGEGTQLEQSDRLADYLNKLRGFDDQYFRKNIKVAVPGIHGFEKDGVRHWSHAKLGNQFVYDGLTCAMNNLEWDYEGHQVRIGAYESSRYSLSGAIVQDEADGTDADDIRDTGVQFVDKFPAETIWPMQMVSLDENNGEAWVELSEARSSHYRRVLGMATIGGDPELGKKVTVQLYGTVAGAAALLFPGEAFDAGTPVFLRDGSPNVSVAPLTGKDGAEDMYQQIGVIDGEDIVLDLREPRVYR